MIAVYNTLLRNSRGLLNVPTHVSTHVIDRRETADQLAGSIVQSARRSPACANGYIFWQPRASFLQTLETARAAQNL